MLGYLRHLANFARIIEAGSVTGAANRAGVSPSQMSESLKVVEAYFGAPLVERHSQGVRPTSLGSQV
ncbi:MAG: LysR family transcriptional regulator [Pseudomonadota bacterium]